MFRRNIGQSRSLHVIYCGCKRFQNHVREIEKHRFNSVAGIDSRRETSPVEFRTQTMSTVKSGMIAVSRK